MKFVLGMVKNNFGTGENSCYQHFLLFPKPFQKPPSLGSSKVRIVWYRVNPLPDEKLYPYQK